MGKKYAECDLMPRIKSLIDYKAIWSNEKCLCFHRKFLLWDPLTPEDPSQGFRRIQTFSHLKQITIWVREFMVFITFSKGSVIQKNLKTRAPNGSKHWLKPPPSSETEGQNTQQDGACGAEGPELSPGSQPDLARGACRHGLQQGPWEEWPGGRFHLSKPHGVWAEKQTNHIVFWNSSVQNYAETGCTWGLCVVRRII